MIIPVVALLLVATVPLTGGRLSRLADLQLVAPRCIVVVLIAQGLLIELAPPGIAAAAHVASYAVAIAWLWWNRAVPGLWLLGGGALANAVAITANGGTMPASAGAVAAAGRTADVAGAGFSNSAVTHDATLWWLGDVLAIPAGIPLSNVVSIGDVLLLTGLGLLLHRCCRADRTADPAGRPTSAPGRATGPAGVQETAG